MNIEKDDFLHSLFHRTPHVIKEREHNLERDRKRCLEEHQSMGRKAKKLAKDLAMWHFLANFVEVTIHAN